MLKRVFKYLLSVYLFIIFFPYIIIVFFYGMMKYFARDGTRLDAQLGKLEDDLIKIMLDTVKNIDINFLLMNIMVLIGLVLLIRFFKKYKIVIPRKKKGEAKEIPKKVGERNEEVL